MPVAQAGLALLRRLLLVERRLDQRHLGGTRGVTARLLLVNERVFALSDARVNATSDPTETARHGEHAWERPPPEL